MSQGSGWLASLVITVRGLAGDRAPALLAGLGPAERAAAESLAADLAALTRAERHGRIVTLGARAPDPRELAARLSRLPPGLRSLVVQSLPLALRPRAVPAAASIAGEAAARWGARLALEWSTPRPLDTGAPSLPRDARVTEVARLPDWPAS